MSERSHISAGPKSNPLYGGPSSKSIASSRTPTWAYKDDGGSGDNSERNSPSASPDRSARSNAAPSPYYAPQYETPGYTVETPGIYDPYMGANASFHGSHLYRPTETYFVQTPAHSIRDTQMINKSPQSSPPGSPQHYKSDMAVYRTGSLYSKEDGSISRKNDESVFDDSDEEFFPDETRDRFRRRRFRTCCTFWSLVILVACLIAGVIACWVVYQPSTPTYTLDYALVNQFQTFEDMLDANGLPTDQLYANLTFVLSVHNPNTRYSSWFDGGSIRVGYSSIDTVMRGKFPKFKQDQLEWASFNGSVSTMAFPLYGAGLALRSDIGEGYVPLMFNATLNSHVDVIWNVVSPKYKHLLECVVNINPPAMQYINDTCRVTKISKW